MWSLVWEAIFCPQHGIIVRVILPMLPVFIIGVKLYWGRIVEVWEQIRLLTSKIKAGIVKL